MFLEDRGIKQANFYMDRESNMSAILIEYGYLDSNFHIKVLREDNKLCDVGLAIAASHSIKILKNLNQLNPLRQLLKLDQWFKLLLI